MTPEALRVRRDTTLPFQEIEGQAVILTPARHELHMLDEVGTFLWNQLEAARSLHELVEALCDTYEVGPERAENDVRAFLASLEAKGLVVRG